jgi:hypothetical protein
MRSILVAGFVLTLAIVPAAQAQEPVAPLEVKPVQSTLIEVPPHWSPADSAGVQAVVAYSTSEATAEAAMREPSARTLLAVIGAVVLVVALVALLL